jgi:hypothetical protein
LTISRSSVATGSGKSDRVFVHSFLGLGLLASRMAVLESPAAAACIPAGAKSSFSFHGRSVQYGGDSAANDVAACSKLVKAEFHKHHFGCDNKANMPGGDMADNGGCFFPGEAHPDADIADEYYLMSFFNDRCVASRAIVLAFAFVFAFAFAFDARRTVRAPPPPPPPPPSPALPTE